jgi:hypothetical protein
VEFEYEGEAPLAVTDIRELFSHIETLFRSPLAAEGAEVSEAAPTKLLPAPASEVAQTVSGPKLHVNSVAQKLKAKTESELAVAAAATPQIHDEKQTFTRTELLDTMKSRRCTTARICRETQRKSLARWSARSSTKTATACTHSRPKSIRSWLRSLLDVAGLKDWLHRDLPSRDKLPLILASFDQSAKLADLRSRSEEASFRPPKKWNLSDVLGKTGGMAIRVPAGWELTDAGKSHLRALGVEALSPAAVQVAADLRKHLANVQNSTTRAFV